MPLARMHAAAAALVLLGACVSAAPAPARLAMETDATHHLQAARLAARGWADVGAANTSHTVELLFALKQQNVGELERELLQVSDPAHARYGQHLTNDQVHALTAPTTAHLKALTGFLTAHGVAWEAATPNSDMLRAHVSMARAQTLLGAEYRRLRHTSGHTVDRVSAAGYSLPAAVAAAVDLVAPTVRVPTIRKPLALKGAAGALFNTPEVVRKIYSVGTAQGRGAGASTKAAVTAFLEQYYSAASLKEFYGLFCTGKGFTCGMDNRVGVVTKGDAPTHPLADGTESMLDIEYITSTGANVTTEFWGFSGRSPDNKNNEPFLKWLTLVSNTSDADVPKLFSTSYGEDEDIPSEAWAVRLNAEFVKAGARGITLLFASGDSGAAGDNGCGAGGVFVPQWPSGSPWVTAVGGTGGAAMPESAASLSSGGFSNRWPRPSWQDAAVAGYLKQPSLPPASKYNVSGRGFPDISAQAENFIIVSDLVPLPGVSGTSCASPTAAGVIALANDGRVAKGKAPFGFLNPLIYAHGSAWNDVTRGSNHGCGLGAGFPALAGWDASTGMGSPNFEKLSQLS